MNNLELLVVDDKLVVDSRQVAELTGKKHFHLLRDIEKYIRVISTNHNMDWLDFFIETTYKDEKGETRPCYRLTRKGCDLVANKMTGEKGILFTASYVDKFHEMEQTLYANAIKLQKETLARYNLLTEKHENLVEENQKLKPKSHYCEWVLKSKDAILVTVLAKDYGMSAFSFNELLKSLGIQYKRGGVWVLKKAYHDKGYTKTKTFIVNKKNKYKKQNRYYTPVAKISTLWTQKGRLFLYNELKSYSILPLMERNK